MASPQPRPKTVVEVLIKALEIFGPNGENWNNTGLHVRKGGRDTYCSLGAIGKAYSGSADSGFREGLGTEATELLATCIPESYQQGYRADWDISDWNDQRPVGKRGFRSIKAVFCKAINKAIDQEGGAKPSKRKASVRKRA